MYVKNLGKTSRLDDAKQIAKLKNDKITLKRNLKVTRHNNGALKNMVDELKSKNEEIEGHLQESKAKITNRTSEIALMKKTIEDLTNKNDKSELKVEELQKTVGELKTNQTEVQNLQVQNSALIKSLEQLKKKNEES